MKKRVITAGIVWSILMLQGIVFALISGLPFPGAEVATIIGATFVIADFVAFLIITCP